MKFKAIVEYEYPVEHKPPVKAEIVLHGDRVITDNIKWIDQEPFINKPCVDKIRAEIIWLKSHKLRADIEWLKLHGGRGRVLSDDNNICIDSQKVLDILDKYRAESEDKG